MTEFKKYRKTAIASGCKLTNDNMKDVGKFIVDHGHKAKIVTKDGESNLVIQTLEGDMASYPGDYVMQGSEGEFWSIKETIFKKTYEEVGPEEPDDEDEDAGDE